MKLSISTSFANPMRGLQRKMEPSSMEHRFRMPGLHGASSGLGSLRRTMPHLMKSPVRMQSGGDLVGQIYSARDPTTDKRRANLYNPDPFHRRILEAQRAQSSQFFNPAMKSIPGSTAMFPYAAGGAAPPQQEEQAPDIEELMEDDQDLGPQQQDERDVVIEAMLALEGRHPDPKEALDRFVQLFGKGALKELQDMVAQKSEGEEDQEDEEEEPGGEAPGEEEEPEQASAPAQGDEEDEEEEPADDEEEAEAGGGLLSGPGSGQSDEIHGTTPSGRKVLLSDGEYVVDAPTVAALGDGSTRAGAARLDQLRKQIRRQAYGNDKQAKPMAKGGGGITVEFG
jgi:hypothetical protein